MLNLNAEDMAPEQAQTPQQGWSVVSDTQQDQGGGWSVVDDNKAPASHPVKDFVGELHSLNPKDWNHFIQQAFWHPINTVGGLLSAHDVLRQKAQKELKSGDVINGTRHFLEWVVPIAAGVAGGAGAATIGAAGMVPATAVTGLGMLGAYLGGVGVMSRADEAGEQLGQGHLAKGLGAMTDAAAMVALPKVAEAAPKAVTAAVPWRPRPVAAPVAEAVQFARERGVGPIDAGTATQSQYIKNMQKGVAATPGGHGTVEAAVGSQQAGLSRVGSELADEIGPQAATTYGQAGTQLRTSFADKITRHGREADEQYAKVRGAGGTPQPTPPPEPAPAGGSDADLAQSVLKLVDRERQQGVPDTEPPLDYGIPTRPVRGDSGGGAEAVPDTPTGEAAYEHAIKAVIRPGFAKLEQQIREKDGGFTYSVTSDTQPTSGFAVSVYKGREVKFSSDLGADAVTNKLAEYVGENWDMLSQDGNHFGGWHNPKDGQVYLDISRVVPDAETANRIGQQAQQQAYFDLAAKTAHDVDYSVTYPETHGQEAGQGAEADVVSGGAQQGRPDTGAPVRAGQAADRAGAVGGSEGAGAGGVGGQGPTAGVGGGPPPDMRAPVDLRPAKVALKPYYQQVLEQWPETQRAASPGFVALKRVVEGPDFRPADAVDQDLSLIKAIVREAPVMLRNRSQGLAAVAVSAIDPAVREAIFKAGGPEAAAALGKGREAVKAKYAAADVMRSLPKEPARIVAKLMAPRDSNAQLLKAVADQLPDRVPDIGRAWLEAELDKATAEGGFTHTDRLWADWDKLGPVTKQTVFGQHLQDINNFFLLAKKLGENPNPSGTAGVLTAVDRMTSSLKGGGVGGAAGYAAGGPVGAAVGGALGALLSRIPSYTVAKLLYTDRGASGLVTIFKAEAGIPVKPEVVGAAMVSVAAEVARIGVEPRTVVLPKAAEEPDKQRPK